MADVAASAEVDRLLFSRLLDILDEVVVLLLSAEGRLAGWWCVRVWPWLNEADMERRRP